MYGKGIKKPPGEQKLMPYIEIHIFYSKRACKNELYQNFVLHPNHAFAPIRPDYPSKTPPVRANLEFRLSGISACDTADIFVITLLTFMAAIGRFQKGDDIFHAKVVDGEVFRLRGDVFGSPSFDKKPTPF